MFLNLRSYSLIIFSIYIELFGWLRFSFFKKFILFCFSGFVVLQFLPSAKNDFFGCRPGMVCSEFSFYSFGELNQIVQLSVYFSAKSSQKMQIHSYING